MSDFALVVVSLLFLIASFFAPIQRRFKQWLIVMLFLLFFAFVVNLVAIS
jgi:hypothetical protein